MKPKQILIFGILLFFFQISMAQINENFEKGSFTNLANETIEGYIKSDDLKGLTKSICFKKLISDKNCKQFDVSQIKSFQTENGKYFELLTFKVDNGTKEITVLANLLLIGESSLYKSFYNDLDIFIVKNKNADKYFVLQRDKFISGDLEVTKNFHERTLNIATDGFSMINYKKLYFRESQFIEIITAYNKSRGFESQEITYKEKNSHFIILAAGGGVDKNDTEYFFQAMHRSYFPKISRSTSLNIGLNYYHYIEREEFDFTTTNEKITTTLTTIPVQIQQNILNKKFRPYLFAGLNFKYITKEDAAGRSLIKNGFQDSYGIGFFFGAGLEFDLPKSFMLKAEFRDDAYQHVILFGIGYVFKRK